MINFDRYKIMKLTKVESTNDEVLNLLLSGVKPPVVVTAEEQTGGRGRAGHKWVSKPGGLYFSIGMRSKGLKTDSKLIVLTSLPVAETLRYYGLNPRIKIPNDVYIGDKKISGILGERKSDFLIIGVGINVNQDSFPDEIKNLATSMFIETGKVFDRNDILYTFLKEFNRLIDSPDLAYDRWVKYVSVIGKKARFTYKGNTLTCEIKAIDKDLNLETDMGKFNIYEIFGFEEL